MGYSVYPFHTEAYFIRHQISIGKIKDSIKDTQKESLNDAKNDLVLEMMSEGFVEEADKVDEVFRLWLW
ncbi:MAG: hypothetical protein WAM14_08750 [Candidatus Nitrosopolaris sp.]